MKTYPKQHNTYVNSVNAKLGGGAKRLARQLKVWKYQRSVPVSSCYLEMRSAKYLDGSRATCNWRTFISHFLSYTTIRLLI